MAVHYNVYCQTTKTCPWHKHNLSDKEDAIQLGREHAIDKHPQTDEWRVRVVTIRQRKRGDLVMELGKK